MHTCETCQAFEKETMAARSEGRDPADAHPCEDYQMSQSFQDWMVEQLRADIMQQVSGQGLDRMAIIKAPESSEEE